MDLSYLKGKFPGDSISLDKRGFILTYGMIRQSYVSSTSLKGVDSLLNLLDTSQKSPVVQILLASFRYQQFKPYALDRGLITYDGIYFHDVTNPFESPYMEDTLFVTSLNKAIYDTTTVSFTLSSHYVFSNLGGIDSIMVDFDDGNDFQKITINDLKNITYPDEGVYNIGLKLYLTTGKLLYSSAQIEIKYNVNENYRDGLIGQERMMGGFSNSPDDSYHIGALPGEGATIHYWYNQNQCMNNKIRKPLIIVEGFDPLGVYGPENVIDPNINNPLGLLDRRYGLDKPIKDLINEENFDLFYIDFVDGKIDIRENAVFVKQAIEWINQQKHINGSIEKNVVLGASMGGLVCKWALREFELNSEDHETELFMSFDSPMRGANIPLALQALPLALGKRKILGIELMTLNNVLAEGYNTVTSKAARQMMYYYLGLCKNGCTEAQLSLEHDEFFTELDSRGELIVPYVALSNGSINGTGMMFEAGAELINQSQFDWWIKLIQTLLPIVSLDIEVKGWALPGISHQNNSNKIAEHTFEYPSILGIPLSSESEVISISDTDFLTYDNAPGGLRTFEAVEDGVVSEGIGWNFKSFCFIPTISALDLRNVSDPFKSGLTNFESTISENAPQIRAYNGATESSLQYEENQVNQEHVSLNNKLANFLLGNIRKLELNDVILHNRTFNYGFADYDNSFSNGTILSTNHTLNNNLTISDEGKLWINRDSRIAFTDITSNPVNNNPKNFDVHLGDDYCTNTPTVVSIQNGGEFQIGDVSVSNIGTLVIHENTTLIVGNGGKLTIENGSDIIVKNGGVLEFLDGAEILINGNGNIHIEKGGKIIVHSGAVIELELPYVKNNLNEISGSKIDLLGELILPEGEITLSGRGFLRFGPDCIYTSELNFYSFNASSTQFVSYVVDDHLTFHKKLFVKDAKVLFNKNIVVENYSFEIDNCHFYSGSELIFSTFDQKYYVDLHGSFYGKRISSSTILNSRFEDVTLVVENVSDDFKSSILLENVVMDTREKPININIKTAGRLQLINCILTTSVTQYYSALNNDSYILNKIGIQAENIGTIILDHTNLQNFKIENGINNKVNSGVFAGIYTYSTPIIVIKNEALVSDCYYGILSKEACNIYCDNSDFTNNYYGISMAGNATSGLVKMTCSSMLNNKLSIYGWDVLLAIDGLENQQSEGTTNIPENNFESGIKDLHFSINYNDKQTPNLKARYNGWLKPENYTIKLGSNNTNLYLEQSPVGLGSCEGKLISLCEDSGPQLPVINSNISQDIYIDGFGEDVIGCQGDSLLKEYWKGYACLYNGEIDSAILHFKPLAKEVYQGDDFSQTPYLIDLFYEANAWVSGYEQYHNIEPQLLLDADDCLLKWTGNNNNNYELQQYINDSWSTIYEGSGPFNVNQSNYGLYRLFVTLGSCDKFISNSVSANCNIDSTCVELIAIQYLEDSLLVEVSLSNESNFEFVSEIAYDPSGPNVCTTTIPLSGSVGSNIYSINYEDLSCDSFGLVGYLKFYIRCQSCDSVCISDTIEDVILIKPAGSEESNNDKLFRVYPNPSSGAFVLDAVDFPYLYTITDIFGSMITTFKSHSKKELIDVSILTAGIYFIEVKSTDGDFIKTLKLIIME